uniref:Uncharacterized protein n=1 Tax=Siphoviridae sp. ct5jB2 TaxID=2825337 RepID=A0A8S5TTI7_9CAUD|nr:MAG TPA: hypothetical protein [Siphoviridae sp. ct5jB2]
MYFCCEIQSEPWETKLCVIILIASENISMIIIIKLNILTFHLNVI